MSLWTPAVFLDRRRDLAHLATELVALVLLGQRVAVRVGQGRVASQQRLRRSTALSTSEWLRINA